MNSLGDIVEIFQNQGETILNDDSSDYKKVICLFEFYNYFDGDASKIDEIIEDLPFDDEPEGEIPLCSIASNVYGEENEVDFNFVTLLDIENFDDERLIFILDSMARRVSSIVHNTDYIGIKPEQHKREVDLFYDSLADKDKEKLYTIRIIFVPKIGQKTKEHFQEVAHEYRLKKPEYRFEIIFSEDLNDLVLNNENPSKYVDYGSIKIYGQGDNICKFGEENSFVCLISADSLKNTYLRYIDKGLLDANLRYHVQSKKIDADIKETILHKSSLFPYLNNGIIIVCDDYKITNNYLELLNFSIVNGGQTTYLIGKLEIKNDFPVICKVIKKKEIMKTDEDEEINFLLMVAEASNSQKPIKSIDLVANRIEQRKLKNQFYNLGIFLRIKRGEVINKARYKEVWESTSNEDVAQALYSFVFQSPGASKNNKSGLIKNNTIYNLIFKDQNYSNDFLKMLQFSKAGYQAYRTSIKRTYNKNDPLYKLVGYMDLMSYAILGLIYYCLLNSEYLKELKTVIDNDFELLDAARMRQSFNLKALTHIEILNSQIFSKNDYKEVFRVIMERILKPAYDDFKREKPDQYFSNFSKTDSYYINFVVKKVINNFENNRNLFLKILTPIFKFEGNKFYVENNKYDDVRNIGHLSDAIAYFIRSETLKNKMNSNNEITNAQIEKIVKYMPSDKIQLRSLCDFKIEQLKLFGDDILKIINKYKETEIIE